MIKTITAQELMACFLELMQIKGRQVEDYDYDTAIELLSLLTSDDYFIVTSDKEVKATLKQEKIND